MKIARYSVATALPIACAVVLCALTSGCDKLAPTVNLPASGRPADAVYTTRGKVESIPVTGKATSEFRVLHEPVDAFYNPALGAVTGMDSMSMPFQNLAAGVTLPDLAIDDTVEITFGVWYKPNPADKSRQVIDTYSVLKIVKLPEGTSLKFGKASPPLGGR